MLPPNNENFQQAGLASTPISSTLTRRKHSLICFIGCWLTSTSADRIAVLDAIKAAKLKTLRLFISFTPANNKATGSVNMPDIEPNQVGTYDDTQLRAIDQLMIESRERGKSRLVNRWVEYMTYFNRHQIGHRNA
jgi:hypothetical protein